MRWLMLFQDILNDTKQSDDLITKLKLLKEADLTVIEKEKETYYVVKAACASHPGESDYWVCDANQQLGSGNSGVAYLLKGKLKIEDNRLVYKPLPQQQDNQPSQNEDGKNPKVIKFIGANNPAIHREGHSYGQFWQYNGKEAITGTNGGYLIIDYFPGTRLDQILNNAGLLENISLEDWVNILYQLTEWLLMFHGKNIIHMDFHPHNILYDHKTKQIHVIDLGLAKPMNSQESFIFADIDTFLCVFGQILEALERSYNFAQHNLVERENELPLSENHKLKVIGSLGITDELKSELKVIVGLRSLYWKAARCISEVKRVWDNKLANKTERVKMEHIDTGGLSLTKLLEEFRFKIKYALLPEVRRACLKTANESAQATKQALHQFSIERIRLSKQKTENDLTKEVDSVEEPANDDIGEIIKDKIVSGLQKVDDDRECLNEFFSVLNIQAFNEIKGNKGEIQQAIEERIESITRDLTSNRNDLLIMLEKIEKYQSTIMDEEFKKPFSQFIGELNSVLAKHQMYGASIDEMVSLNSIFEKAINKYKKKYEILNQTYEIEKAKQQNAKTNSAWLGFFFEDDKQADKVSYKAIGLSRF